MIGLGDYREIEIDDQVELLSAAVRPTMEIIVTASPAHLRKHHDPETGLALIGSD